VELADVIKSLRLHWRVSVAIVLLAGLGFAVFLITRNQVQPANRYRVDVQILVPAADSKGVRPAGVPPSLLQGQVQQALNTKTETAALDAARVPTDKRKSIEFGFSSNATNDILTLSAKANDKTTASNVALAFETAYVATRAKNVADGATGGKAGAQASLKKLSAALTETNADIESASPGLVGKLKAAALTKGPTGTGILPDGSPDSLVLLVVQRQAYLNQIQAVQNNYAQDSIIALIPNGFASVVEVNLPVQTTPKLPSPLIPALVFVAVGLALARAVPVVSTTRFAP
jgi:hypothetical protein